MRKGFVRRKFYNEMDDNTLRYLNDRGTHIGNDYYDPPPYTGHYQRRTRPGSKKSEEFDELNDELRFRYSFDRMSCIHRRVSGSVNKKTILYPSSSTFSSRRRKRIEISKPKHEQMRSKKPNGTATTFSKNSNNQIQRRVADHSLFDIKDAVSK